MTTMEPDAVRSEADCVFDVRNLRKWYRARRQGFIEGLFKPDEYLRAVDDVSFDIRAGEIMGLAGQSGCGKSTLGELLVALQKPTGGEIRFGGEDITSFGNDELLEFRRKCQVIFQDPYEAINPRFPVARVVTEPLTIHKIGDRAEREERTRQALRDAGLTPPEAYLEKLPDELSGGERQRVCIARALVLDPEFLVADEPVSMLDVSVRTGILKLFKRLQRERNLSMLYVSHDLSTINYLADRTMIMYMGKVVELGPTEQVIHDPAHPYTEALLESVPDADPDVDRAGSRIDGEVPDPVDLPGGCRFHPNCEYATEDCRKAEPELAVVNGSESELTGDDSSESRQRLTACYHPVNE